MIELDDQQQAARNWFESLRDRICTAFEEIEREAGSGASFAFNPWERTDATGEPGGGGVRGQMTGKIFEKVGVNVSTVVRAILTGVRQEHPRRRRGPELLCDRHQPGCAHGQSARASRPYEHALPHHDQALVRRRR